MLTDIGEYFVGAYLKLKLDCDVIDYNVRPLGGNLKDLEEMDVQQLQLSMVVPHPHLLIGLYRIRLGFAPSSPRRLRLSPSYS